MQATDRMASVVSSTLPARRRVISGVRPIMHSNLQDLCEHDVFMISQHDLVPPQGLAFIDGRHVGRLGLFMLSEPCLAIMSVYTTLAS